MSRKRPRSPDPPCSSPADLHQTFRSAAIKDRASTFIALFSPTASAKYLQDQAEFKTATHRITAWRKPSSQRSLPGLTKCQYDTGHDDDGERWAGQRLEKILAEMNVEGAVVVARWYGGVMLGPVRFTHIENCAKEAIENWKRELNSTDYEGPASQKRKLGNEDEERRRLVKILEERDHSISVLRDLLAEKEKAAALAEKASDPKGSKNGHTKFSPLKPVDYSGMTLPTLQRVERGRDATISWLLRQIENAEQHVEKNDDHG